MGYEKGRVALITVADGKEVASLALGKVATSQVAFSSDSQLLAIGGSDERANQIQSKTLPHFITQGCSPGSGLCLQCRCTVFESPRSC